MYWIVRFSYGQACWQAKVLEPNPRLGVHLANITAHKPMHKTEHNIIIHFVLYISSATPMARAVGGYAYIYIWLPLANFKSTNHVTCTTPRGALQPCDLLAWPYFVSILASSWPASLLGSSCGPCLVFSLCTRIAFVASFAPSASKSTANPAMRGKPICFCIDLLGFRGCPYIPAPVCLFWPDLRLPLPDSNVSSGTTFFLYLRQTVLAFIHVIRQDFRNFQKGFAARTSVSSRLSGLAAAIWTSRWQLIRLYLWSGRCQVFCFKNGIKVFVFTSCL